jgi:AbrB family looped-hinge helix DNA binding protein
MVDVRRVDIKGRILIPKTLREKTRITEGTHVKMETDGKRIIIQPIISAATRHYGRFKVESVPDDLEEYLEGEILRRWLNKQHR